MKASFLRIITGLVIVAIGLVTLAANLGMWNIKIDDIWTAWWPLLVIAGGVLMFLNDTRSYVWALLTVIVGIVFQLHTLDIVQVNPWQVIWPMIIIAAGIMIAVESGRRSKVAVSKKDHDSVTAILGGSDKRYSSDNYKGTNVMTIMGGVKLDLSKVTIKKEAVVSVTAIMGGVELVVPRNVAVRNEVVCVLGSTEDKTSQDAPNDAPVLIVTGEVALGGIEIKN